MKRLLKLIIFIPLLQTYLFARASGKQTIDNDIPERKPLIIQTLVVDKGKPNAIIVIRKTPEFQTLANKIQLAIKTATGARLDIVDVKKIVSPRGEFPGQAPDKNMIVLGSIQNNGLIAHLYFRGYCAVDANYPGPTGYVVQTVCDPWATGANVIVLGGSNMPGVKKAVERFCKDIPKGATLNIPRKLKAVVHKNYDAPDLTDDGIAKVLVQATADFKAGKHNGLFIPIVKAANAYKMTGKEGQAKLFRDMLYLEHDLMINSPNDFDSPWGGGADMQFAPLMMAWDNVEESPSLSDADRHKIMGIILEYIHYYEHYAYMAAFKTGIIRHNHHTFPGQGFSAAGRYFCKYYPGFAGGPKWLGMGDDCFRVQEKSWKSQENSSAYVGLATRHMCYYAATRPDFTWFDSGRANIAGDLSIMTMDNLGSQCAFGDMEGYNPRSSHELWNYLIMIERNGRYSWAVHKARNAIRKTPSESDSMPVHVTPVEPKDLLGTKYMPVDSLFYVSLNGTGKNQGKVSRVDAFDKLSFRSSFDPQRQYMAIDGMNIGYHSHKDGNSVLRLSDHGRIWLADADYIKSSPKYHNTLLIFRDGEATAMPNFIKRDLVADLPGVGITRTTTADYGGTDWTRNIIWDKERAFVFIDEVKANSTQSYSVRTLWHTLGKPWFKGSTFNLSQKGESFAIQNLDGSQLRDFRDAEIGKNWVEYKYADPVINTLQQIRTTTLRKGDKIYVINVLSAQADGKTPIAAARVNDSSLLLGSGREQALIGLGYLKAKGIETDARLYRLTHQRISLAGVRQLKLNNKKIFRSTDSVSAELSANGVMLDGDKRTKITFYNAGNKVYVDKKPVKSAGGIFTVDLPAGKHTVTGVILAKEFAIQFPAASKAEIKSTVNLGAGKLVEKAAFSPGKSMDTRPFAAGTTGAYIAGSNGVLYALTTDLKPRWNYNVGGNIRAVWTGRLEKNAPERIAVANAEGRVVVLDQNGKLLWEQLVPFYRNSRAVAYLLSADLAGDGNRALIVGSQNWYNYAYDTTGKMLWKFLVVHMSSTGAVADLDGDGKDEVIAGTIYYSWSAINHDGKRRWSILGGPGANAIAAADLTGTGKKMTFIAGADGNLYAVEADGKRPWTYSTGDGATAVGFLDIDGDGKKEILVSSLSSNVVALKPDGKPVWRSDLGEPILCMAQTDLDGDGQMEIIVGTQDGHVIALNHNGQPVSHWTTTGSVNKLVALDKGCLAAGTSTGKVVILSMK